jgi:fumarate reductase flavoprotein subunit
MELGPRDRLSQAFTKERDQGRTITLHTAAGDVDVVHLDVRHLGEKKINKKIPFVRELARNYAGIDPVYEPIPVRPVVHYMMGGVSTDKEGATKVPGLFAAGECACVSINGANRLGSNSLTELLVFGARAARSAARFAAQHPNLNVTALQAQAEDEQKHIAQRFFHGQGKEIIAAIRLDLNHTMEEGAGIYRTESSLKATCDVIRKLKERYQQLGLQDKSLSFNTELTTALELGFMLDAAEAVVFSALARQESRGSHQRTDFPKRDDAKYLKHSLAYRTEADPRIDYLDVVITRWPPGERVYGAK